VETANTDRKSCQFDLKYTVIWVMLKSHNCRWKRNEVNLFVTRSQFALCIEVQQQSKTQSA